MLIYMAIYVTMNVGTFAFILSMERDGAPCHVDRQPAPVCEGTAQGAGDAGPDVQPGRRAADAGLLRQASMC
jgi:hypothetical protein